ncbi:hypothetical protein LJC55_03550 [Eubacteriales bacterium OttesenSCG-928-N14]|nr:hypothetical protein [Eubacteriales bacterium OttesenSCG-928-N14]
MSEKQFLISGTPLLKFQTRERIEQLQSGKIYMKSLHWYREFAKNSPVIGDDYEAMLHINQATMLVADPESGQPIAHQQIDDGLISTIHSNDYVFCMFGINPHSAQFVFTDEQKNDMQSFGDTVLIITDSDEFHRRIKAALISTNLPLADVHCGFISYYDESIDSVNVFCSLINGMHNVAFQKRNKYAYQQEYRFLLPNNGRTEDFFELQIGDISDISEIITSQQALEAIIQRHEQEEQDNGQA